MPAEYIRVYIKEPLEEELNNYIEISEEEILESDGRRDSQSANNDSIEMLDN